MSLASQRLHCQSVPFSLGLVQFFPTFSKTAEEKAALRAIRIRELRVHRRYPSFILGLLFLGASCLVAFFVVGGFLGFFIGLGAALGFGLVHDTITLHLLRVIQQREEQRPPLPDDITKVQPCDPVSTGSRP
jgi:hypothetical protein